MSNTNLDLENLKPQLKTESECIDFLNNIFYLKNPQENTYLKLTKGEKEIVAELNGENTIADILEKQLRNRGTNSFQTIFELIVKLNSGKFLEQNEGVRQEHKDKISKILNWHNKKLFDVNWEFKNTFLQKIAKLLSSTIAIVLWGAMAVYCFMNPIDYSNINIFQAFALSPAQEHLRFTAYIISFVGLWLTFSLVLSFKNIFSAYILSSHQCLAIKPYFKTIYGCVYFTVNLDDIVKAGAKPTYQLYLARILSPFLAVLIFTVLWQNVLDWPLFILLQQACLIICFLGVCPLFKSDLIALLALVTPYFKNMKQITSFLTKRFVLAMFSFSKKIEHENFYISISLLSLGWLYFFLQYFWNAIETGAQFLLVDLFMISGPIWGKAIIVLYLLLIILSLLALLISSVVIGIVNLKSAARNPLHQINKFAAQINKQKIPAKEQFIEYLQQIPLFAKLTEEDLKTLCEYLHIVRVAKGKNIIIQNEKGKEFYNIISGRVAVIQEDDTGIEKWRGTLTTGDSFGEIALLENTPRTATVRAIEKTTLITLDKKYFDEFLLKTAEAKEKITDIIRMGRLIQGIAIFSKLSPRQISTLIVHLKKISYTAGETVFNQGDQGDKFYIIESGEALVEHKEQEKITLEQTLEKGGYFGEIALIKNIPRTASIKAKTDINLLYLTKTEFYNVVKHNIFTGIKLEDSVTQRLQVLGEEVKKLC